jgi:hypothetical protein
VNRGEQPRSGLRYATVERQGDEPRYPLGVVVYLCTVCHEMSESARSNCHVCGAPVRATQVFNANRRDLGRG